MIAVYPGTFDPFTNGHLDLLNRSKKIFNQVIIAVAVDTQKKTLFSTQQRVALAKQSISKHDNIKVMMFDGLLIDFAKKINAKVIIRGLRAVSDFEYEFQLATMNHNLSSDIETMFLTPAEEYSFLSSSMIKDVVRLGGDASKYLHPAVFDALRQKFGLE